MQKNTASKWVVFAFQSEAGTNPGQPVTGDAANITANIRIDGGAANAVDDTNPTELEDGYYVFDVTAAESNGDSLAIMPESSTANVNVIGVPGALYTHPANFPDMAITATNGRIDVGEWLGQAVTLSTGNLPDVNVSEISDDSLAADNLELMYDGTGYTDDTAPASRAQVSNIGAASGGSIFFAPVEDNTGGAIDPSSAVFVGSVVIGTFADLDSDINSSHSIDDVGNDIDIVYGYDIGPSKIATSILVFADVDGGADQIDVEVYDHVGASWDALGEIDDNTTLNAELTSKYTGTGSELGKVYLRFNTTATTPANLEVFKCLVAGVSVQDGVANGSTITLTETTANENFIGHQFDFAMGGQDISGTFVEGSRNVSGTGTTASGNSAKFRDCVIADGVSIGASIKFIDCVFAGTTTYTSTSGVSSDFCKISDSESGVPGGGNPTHDFSGVTKTTLIQNRMSAGGTEVEINSFCTLSLEVVAGGTQTIVNAGGIAEVRVTTCKAIVITSSGSATTNIASTTAVPITINGTGGTVTIVGVHSGVTDNSGGSVSVTSTNSQDLTSLSTSTPNEIRDAVTGGAYSLDTDANGRIRVVSGTADGEIETTSGAVNTVLTANTCTTNTDMRGTDNALLAASAPTNFEDLAITATTGRVDINANNDKSDYTVAGTIQTLDALDAAQDVQHATTQSSVSAVETDTQDIQSRLPAALVSGRMDANISAINDNSASAVNLALSAGEIVVGQAQTGTLSTTQMSTDLAEATDDHYIGRVIIWTSGALKSQATDITDYTGTGGVLTFTATTEAPTNGDTFVIV